MYKKIFSCLFGACVLLQLASGNAISKEDSSSEETEVTPRQGLLIYAVFEFSTLSKYIVDNGKVVMANVLKDMEKLETKSDALQTNITRITDYFENVKKFDETSNDMSELFELSSEFTDILGILDDAEKQEPDNVELQALSKSYKEHGGEKFDKEAKDRLKVFVSNFSEKFDEYAKELSADEKAKEKKLFDWYTDYKAEEDSEKQMEIFFKFFEILAEEKS